MNLFYLSKVLWFLFNPINLIILFILIGFLLNLLNYIKISKYIYIFSFILFFITSVLPSGSYLNFLLEKNFHNMQYNFKNIDGILILSGATNPYLTNIHNQINLNSSAERLVESVILMKKFPKAKIVFSGGSGTININHSKFTHSYVANKFFVNMGINANRIIYEKKSRNTFENILFSKNIINPKNNEKWILITSAFHLKRSLAIAKKLKWNLIPYPVDFNKDKKFNLKFSSFFNFLSNISEFNKSMHEWIGIFAYKLMGRL